mmetsp:Transcript_34013/g.91168  ORF Transcript_34013/g.91168 Transcript_34013/m.91168 type:complete len:210 (-) Transcript_34013:28-657(-)
MLVHVLAIWVVAVPRVDQREGPHLAEEAPHDGGRQGPLEVAQGPGREVWHAQGERRRLVQEKTGDDPTRALPDAAVGHDRDAGGVEKGALGRPRHLRLRAQRAQEAFQDGVRGHQALRGEPLPAQPPPELLGGLDALLGRDSVSLAQQAGRPAALLSDEVLAGRRGPVELQLPQLPLCLGRGGQVLGLQGHLDLLAEADHGLLHRLARG